MKVELTKLQCVNLVNFIEVNLLDAIRKDPNIDGLDYIESLLTARNACLKAVAEYEGN